MPLNLQGWVLKVVTLGVQTLLWHSHVCVAHGAGLGFKAFWG